jgi:hypothetical protein
MRYILRYFLFLFVFYNNAMDQQMVMIIDYNDKPFFVETIQAKKIFGLLFTNGVKPFTHDLHILELNNNKSGCANLLINENFRQLLALESLFQKVKNGSKSLEKVSFLSNINNLYSLIDYLGSNGSFIKDFVSYARKYCKPRKLSMELKRAPGRSFKKRLKRNLITAEDVLIITKKVDPAKICKHYNHRECLCRLKHMTIDLSYSNIKSEDEIWKFYEIAFQKNYRDGKVDLSKSKNFLKLNGNHLKALDVAAFDARYHYYSTNLKKISLKYNNISTFNFCFSWGVTGPENREYTSYLRFKLNLAHNQLTKIPYVKTHPHWTSSGHEKHSYKKFLLCKKVILKHNHLTWHQKSILHNANHPLFTVFKKAVLYGVISYSFLACYRFLASCTYPYINQQENSSLFTLMKKVPSCYTFLSVVGGLIFLHQKMTKLPYMNSIIIDENGWYEHCAELGAELYDTFSKALRYNFIGGIGSMYRRIPCSEYQ